MASLAKKMVDLGDELFDYRGKVILGESADSAYLIDNPNRRCPIITKARTELGYDPQVGIDEGLRRSMIWYGENSHAIDA